MRYSFTARQICLFGRSVCRMQYVEVQVMRTRFYQRRISSKTHYMCCNALRGWLGTVVVGALDQNYLQSRSSLSGCV